MAGWTTRKRRFAGFVGLEADAEWLLDAAPGDDGSRQRGSAAPLFQRKTLAAETGDERPPFAFLLAPEPAEGEAGKALLAALDRVDDALSGEGLPYRFNMSAADRARLAEGGTAGALCDQKFFDALAGSDFAEMPKAMRLSSALRAAAAPEDRRLVFPDAGSQKRLETLAKRLGEAFKNPAVVLGVIDDDFAVAHPRLIMGPGASRIASYWDQEADRDPSGATTPFGRELAKPALDRLLRGFDGPLAEFYALPALAPFYPKRRNHMPRNASHGTHVLDILAGAPSGTGGDRPVVAVKLPRASVLDTSGAHLEFFLLEAVRHIVERARMIVGGAQWKDAEPKVVIVASYGFFGGPLDGGSLFERALDAGIAAHGGRVQVVLPSGNGRLARAHAVRARRDEAGRRRTAAWRLPAGDRTPSVMEIWSEPIAASGPRVALSLVTPDGLQSPALRDDDLLNKLALTDGASRTVAEAVCAHPSTHPGRRLFLVWLAPTAEPPPDVSPMGLAPAGVWTVRLDRIGSAEARTLSIWIRRDDSLPGYPRLGLQSGIERAGPYPPELWPDDDPPGDSATRRGTLNRIASGGLTVTVGGFSLVDLRAAAGSAGGPVAAAAAGLPNLPSPLARRTGPDCMAPYEVSPLRGVKAANFFGGAKVGYRGTSVAAPLLGHALAEALAAVAGAPGDAAPRLKAAALADAAERGFAGTPYAPWRPSPERGGAGRFVDAAMVARSFPLDGGPA